MLQAVGHTIWTYNDITKLDTLHEYSRNFQKVATNATFEHAIRLKNAKWEDEGTYFCIVEYYDGGFSTDKAHMKLTIVGM